MLVHTALSHRPNKPLSPDKKQAIALISLLNRSTSNTFIGQIAEMLAHLGWQIDLFTGLTPEASPIIVHQSPSCRLIKLPSAKKNSFYADSFQRQLGQFLPTFKKFQIRQGTNYPLIHTFDWLSGWIGLQFKNQINVQFVHTFNSFVAHINPQQLVQRQIAQIADRLIVTSKEYSRFPLWLPINKVEILPEDLAESNRSRVKESQKAIAIKTELGFSSNESIILYAGNFTSLKNWESIIKAFQNCVREFTTARLVLIELDRLSASANARKRCLQQLIRDLDLSTKVVFVGQVQPELIPLYYQTADICVIPSAEQPLTKVALEAAAWDTPVIAVNEPDLRFTVLPEITGLLVPPEDTSAWHKAIARLLSSRQNTARQSEFELFPALETKEPHTFSNCDQTKIAIYLSYLYRYLLARTLTPQLEWTAPIVPWQNFPTNLIVTGKPFPSPYSKISHDRIKT